MWDLPRPGLKPVSPALAGRFSTTAPQGKPGLSCLNAAWALGLGTMPQEILIALKAENHCSKRERYSSFLQGTRNLKKETSNQLQYSVKSLMIDVSVGSYGPSSYFTNEESEGFTY